MARDQHLHASQGSPASRSVQTVQHAIGAPRGDGFRELSAAEATQAFEQMFAGLSERIRNRQVLETAQLKHDADGVLQVVGKSPKTRSEDSGEGGAAR